MNAQRGELSLAGEQRGIGGEIACSQAGWWIVRVDVGVVLQHGGVIDTRGARRGICGQGTGIADPDFFVGLNGAIAVTS